MLQGEQSLPDSLLVYLPVVAAFFGALIFLWLLHWLLLGRHDSMGAQARLPRQLLMLVFNLLALVLVIILFPMSDSTRGQVITLVGLVITGVIALSSTSFVANIMAGLMLHVVKSFNPGDFIRVGQQFGRVTERGLFHTEIQTEDRDLSTIPNLHLATNPVTVVHSTGTIISAELSLGYDIPREHIEDLLKQAALRAELQDPFVLVISLGDFSVVYRISGFLAEVKNLITAKSTLKKYVLDVLHENKVEIVSPAFMNQRQLSGERKIIPQKKKVASPKKPLKEITPEEMIFDKAEVAAEAEILRAEIDKLGLQLDELTKSRKGRAKAEQEGIDFEIHIVEEQRQRLTTELEKIAASETEDKK
jgi:small-conductance mechanosensitive channel